MQRIPLILTCAGKSSRFGDEKPKWLQTHPSGNIMAVECLRGLRFEFEIILCIAPSHAAYGIERIKDCFTSQGYTVREVLQIDSKSQVETVQKAIANMDFDFFVVRDCDSFVSVSDVPMANFVTYYDASNSAINIHNKSTVQVMAGEVISLREKSAHSPLISVGLYGFMRKDFENAIPKTIKQGELYLSDIYQQVKSIRAVEAHTYSDWGTKDDWIAFKQEFATLFVDIDGTLVRSSHRHFAPRWGESEPLEANIAFINRCYNSGKKHIILTTSRTEDYRSITEKQLWRFGVNYHALLMGLPVCKRVVINDFDVDSGVIGCGEINIPRNSDKLELEYRARIGR
jgi:hypothetical protein